jgi:hypothetical protein
MPEQNIQRAKQKAIALTKTLQQISQTVNTA